MKIFAKIFIFAAMLVMSVGAFAQSTTEFNFQVPTSCGVYASMYSCSLQAITPSGNNAVNYAPHSGYPFGYLYFQPSNSLLGDLNWATIDSVTTSVLSSSNNGKKPGTTGYIGITNYKETTTFHEQNGNPLTFTGSTDIWYTTTTQCCSSGRGPSQHTVWTITGGYLLVTE